MLPIYLQATSSNAPKRVNDINKMDLGLMKDIVKYLHIREVLENGKQAHKLNIQVAQYTLVNDQLYRRSFGGPFLRCLNDTEAQYVLNELHEGICENHLGGQTLAHYANSQGYYWPTMKNDAKNYV